MIDAKELRIGNILRHKELDKEFSPTGSYNTVNVNEHTIYEIASGMHDDLEPIPLTEEWLVNLVFFESLFAGYFTNSKGIGLLKSDGGFWLLIYKNHSIIKVGTIHQLQNLYFALTGEELIIASADQPQ